MAGNYVINVNEIDLGLCLYSAGSKVSEISCEIFGSQRIQPKQFVLVFLSQTEDEVQNYLPIFTQTTVEMEL